MTRVASSTGVHCSNNRLQLAEQKENDPETIAELRTQVSQAKEAANRWVGKCAFLESNLQQQHSNAADNYWALKSHCVKKLSVASSEFDRMLQVPSDIDYMQ